MVSQKELFQLYQQADIKTRLYMRIKLRICPLLLLEKYVPSQGKIVDLGCGNGLFPFILKLGSPNREVIGLDFDEKKLKQAEIIQAGSNLGQFIYSDLSRLEFPAADIYTLIDVLYLLPYPQQIAILTRCYKLLPPGGYILVKEIDTRPRWKYWWNYFQESIAVRIVGFTRGKKFYFRPAGDWSSILQQIGCQTSIIPLHKGYWYSHVLIIGQK